MVEASAVSRSEDGWSLVTASDCLSGVVSWQLGKMDIQEFVIKNTSLVPVAWKVDATELHTFEVRQSVACRLSSSSPCLDVIRTNLDPMCSLCLLCLFVRRRSCAPLPWRA